MIYIYISESVHTTNQLNICYDMYSMCVCVFIRCIFSIITTVIITGRCCVDYNDCRVISVIMKIINLCVSSHQSEYMVKTWGIYVGIRGYNTYQQ